MNQQELYRELWEGRTIRNTRTGNKFKFINNRVHCVSGNGFAELATITFAKAEEFEVVVPKRWEDQLEKQKILCWVSDEDTDSCIGNGGTVDIILNYISSIANSGGLSYESIDTMWRYAVPLTPEEVRERTYFPPADA